MELDINVKPDDTPEAAKHKLAKMVLGTVTGFIAKEFAEKGYDMLLKRYQDKNIIETVISKVK